MKNKKYLFVGLFVLAILPAYATSLLQPTSFPKTFNDVPFNDRMAVLAEGYSLFAREYDENGRCISGCPYMGITIAQDEKDSQEATEYFAELVANSIDDTENEPLSDSTTPGASFPDLPSGSSANSIMPVMSITHPGPEPISQTSPSLDDAVGVSSVPRVKRSALPLRSPLDIDIVLNDDFGWRNTVINGKKRTYLHDGIDINAAIDKRTHLGQNVYATGDGTVAQAASGYNGGNGNYIRIRHAKGFFSEYKHLSAINVLAGQEVRAGDKIGMSGNTGFSSGPHLHYDVILVRDGKTTFVDVLCPCASSKFTRNEKESLRTQETGLSCDRSALNTAYKFRHKNIKKTEWRIKAGHCMQKDTDKLPDEQ